MGQPVTVIRSSSRRPGVVRFEVNRILTGMGHKRYHAEDEILGDDPAAEVARRIFAAGGVESVHIYSSMITVYLSSTDPVDLESVIADLHTYYVPGVEIPDDAELIALAGS